MNTFRLALRRLRAAPVFTLSTVVTLALGIGANTLVFSAVHGLLLRPLPVGDDGRLAWVFATTRESAVPGHISGDEADAIARVGAFAAFGVIGDRGFVREVGAEHVRWKGIWVTTGVAAALGVRPAAGRLLGAGDFGASPPAMLIGYERWQHDFGGDPSVVGRELPFADNKRFRVVGVLPRGLEFPFGRAPQGGGNGTGFTVGIQDFWILGEDGTGLPGGAAIVRLRPDGSHDRARDEAAAASAALTAREGRRLVVVPFREQALGPLAAALPFLQGFTALVFAIAAVNVAGLLLVRAASHATEAAVRLALGARTRDLFTIALVESACLSGAAAGLAVALAFWGRAILWRLAGTSPILARIEIDAPVLVAAIAMGAAVTIVTSVLPAAAASRVPLVSTLGRAGQRIAPGRARRVVHALVVAQLTLSTVLVAGAFGLRTSLARLLAADAGYERERVVAADVLLFIPNAAPALRLVHDRLRALPGVEAVGFVHSTPLTGKWVIKDAIGLLRGGPPEPTPPVSGNFVAFEYFAAMGIPIVAGRGFTEAEFLGRRPEAVIVNDVAARAFFPGADAVGQRVMMYGRARTIVGVVGGTRDVRLEVPAEPQVYEPMFFGSSQIVIRASGDPSRLVPAIRRELKAADPRVIVESVAPLAAIVDASIVERRVTAHLASVLAALALVLAVVGLYGMMQSLVSSGRRAFGVRAALGATPGRLVGVVLGQGLTVAAPAVVMALVLALPLGGLVRPLLYDVKPADPLILAATGGLVVAAAVAACLPAAWRAASADPADVLRAE